MILGLENLSNNLQKFELKCDGFGSFGSRVIFVDIALNDYLLEVQKSVSDSLKRSIYLIPHVNERPYSPHITVAFRDLKKKSFESAWEKFKSKSFDFSFEVNSLCILKRTGQYWEIHKEILFKGNDS